MKGFFLCLCIILTFILANPDPILPKKRSLEDTDFSMLLDKSTGKVNKDSKSFFDFKEAKILAKKRMDQDAPTPSVVAEASVDSSKPTKVSRKLQRKARSRPHPSDIKLDPHINKLMPNVDQLLADLKPQRSLRLLQKKKKTVKARSGDSAQAAPSADLEAFSTFDKEVQAASVLSNHELRRNFDRSLSRRQSTAELNYQNFIRFASDRYMETLASVYTRNQDEYNLMQIRVAANLRKSIQRGIRAHSKLLDAKLRRRFERVTRRKFHKLTKDIEAMQAFYNGIYAEDRRMVNKLLDLNQPVPASQEAWDARDEVYRHANLKPDGKS
jgi:ribosomal protein S25